jgi:hypothetical protein
LYPLVVFWVCASFQTHADYESEALRLLDAGEGKAAFVEEDRVQQACGEWAGRSADHNFGSTRAAKRPRKGHKFYRTKTQQWLLEMDNALLGPHRLGGGLARFKLPADFREKISAVDLLAFPTLVVASDQGPDAWAAQNYMEAHDYCIVREPDTQNHGFWNDCLGPNVCEPRQGA